MNTSCIFCHPPPERIFYTGDLVVGLWDEYPVSNGHALLIPRRHVETWFDATEDEQRELLQAIRIVREVIGFKPRPDVFNIGVNVGAAAGQTVFHLHVDIIPRYRGDVADPRRWRLRPIMKATTHDRHGPDTDPGPSLFGRWGICRQLRQTFWPGSRLMPSLGYWKQPR